MSENVDWFKQYFKLFRDNAPDWMVQWGGYQSGLPTGMASSLESIVAFSKLVENRESIILDAGAGVSTWMLRKIFPNVISIDPHEEYLLTVKSICKIGGLNCDNFLVGIDNIPTCDYTYYDYGNLERQPNMIAALDKTRKLIYFDDTDTRPDCAPLRSYVYQLATDKHLTITDCLDAKDEYGRWGTIIKL